MNTLASPLRTIGAETRIGDIVTAHPALARLFERLQIDYCCGGNRALSDACAQATVICASPSWTTSAAGSYNAPGRIVAPVRFTQVALTIQSTCALDTDGGTWCFGIGVDGSLGNGTRGLGVDYSTLEGQQPLPTRVAGAPPFVKIEARGYTTCGMTSGGEVWCWGRSARGDTGMSLVPVLFSHRHRFVDFAVSGNGPCGVTTDGAVLCTRVHAYQIW